MFAIIAMVVVAVLLSWGTSIKEPVQYGKYNPTVRK